jgi:hypothetical protein
MPQLPRRWPQYLVQHVLWHWIRKTHHLALSSMQTNEGNENIMALNRLTWSSRDLHAVCGEDSTS